MQTYAPLLASATNYSANEDAAAQFETGQLPNSLSWMSGSKSSASDDYVTRALSLTSATDNQPQFNIGSTVSNIGGAIGGMGGGSSMLGAVGGGIGTAVGIYNNSTTDTTGSVLSGAASGAAAGAAFGPWGMVIGGVIGGVIGLFGSKSKKNAAKKAYQQQLEAAIAPQKQQQANYLQNQGLLQKAISNYGSAYTAGGPTYTNPLLKNRTNSPFTFGQPTQPASLPDFSKGPNDVVTGQTQDTTKGISPLWQGQTNGNLLTGQRSTTPMTYTMPQQQGQQTTAPTPPGWTGNDAQDKANAAKYQQDYANYIAYTNQQRAGQAVGNYSQFYGG